MKRLIRNKAGLYLKSDGGWTQILEEAINFTGIQELISTKQHFGLKDVDFVLMSDTPDSPQTVLPLDD